MRRTVEEKIRKGWTVTANQHSMIIFTKWSEEKESNVFFSLKGSAGECNWIRTLQFEGKNKIVRVRTKKVKRVRTKKHGTRIRTRR